MAIPPDIAVLEDLQHRQGMTGIRNEIGIHHIEEASFDKVGNVRVPVSYQPGFPSRLWRPWTEEGHQLLSNCFQWASPVPSPEKFLNATKCASDCTATSGLYDFPGVIEFFVKKVTFHVRKPVKVCLPANIFFLQVSPRVKSSRISSHMASASPRITESACSRASSGRAVTWNPPSITFVPSDRRRSAM